MALSNTHTEFGPLARTLHWAVAVGIWTLVYLGLQQSGVESGPERTEIRAVHSSIALLVVHVVAALYRHFVAKNDVLRRITVGARRA